MIKDYTELDVWKLAMDLVVEAYKATATFPASELYGLQSQMQRAAVSVPSNIAEGFGRSSTRDFLHHLAIGNGSLKELETQFRIAQRLGYIDQARLDEILALTEREGQMLNRLQASLRKKLDES